MTERPILFSGPMVRAILEGRKTQTRRVVKTGNYPHEKIAWWEPAAESGNEGRWSAKDGLGGIFHIPCPYGQPGDRLWVRETWQMVDQDGEADASASLRERLGSTAPFRGVQGDRPITWRAVYRADGEAEHPTYGPINWRPSIHMPRWASRLTLEVTAVWVERLKEIDENGAMAEGLCGPLLDRELDGIVNQIGRAPRECFAELWNSIYAGGGHGWDTNPWVWVVEFTPQPPTPWHPGGTSD